MSAINIYNEPQDILFKVLREGRRTSLTEDPIEKCDHFFNFCVTAHSLRDWCIKYLKIADTNSFHDEINRNFYFGVCRDIANSSKHFGLDKPKSTVNEAKTNKSKFALLDGTDNPAAIVEREDILITLSDGTTLNLFEFLHNIGNGWMEIFKNKLIPINKSLDTSYMFIQYT